MTAMPRRTDGSALLPSDVDQPPAPPISGMTACRIRRSGTPSVPERGPDPQPVPSPKGWRDIADESGGIVSGSLVFPPKTVPGAPDLTVPGVCATRPNKEGVSSWSATPRVLSGRKVVSHCSPGFVTHQYQTQAQPPDEVSYRLRCRTENQIMQSNLDDQL